MAPKKASGSASNEPAHEFKNGEIVLCKVKGYPEWPGKIVEHDVAPSSVMKQKGNKSFLVRFFPDGDFHWAVPKEMKYLPAKNIEAYLSDTSKKNGKLRVSYEIAKDPTQWEEDLKNGALPADEDDDDEDGEDEDVDMLEEDGEAKPKGKKRKRDAAAEDGKKKDGKKGKAAAPAKKEKKETAPAKKRKTDDKKEAAAKPASKAGAAKDKKAAPAGEDTSEGAKTTKGWRATLQKAFLTKGVPAADKMPEFDQIFTAMENFDMQSEWLTQSKLGKVLKKMASLADVARDEEFKIIARSSALIDKWKEMMVKEGGEEPGAAAAAVEGGEGDVTMQPTDADEKEKPASAAPEAEEEKKAETNGDAAAAPAPAVEEKKMEATEESKAEEEKPVETAQTNGAEEAAPAA